METPDVAELNIEKSGVLFPDVIAETMDTTGKPQKTINFEPFKQMLSSEMLEVTGRMGFIW